ncbi:putative Sporulation domain protein [Pseudodesulfovibrio profundus]|uniref:Putative Sporulation domain protein n=1 Tax=Pseudodesulfovibrio profundus TaxID=57320 RepID=A0A2C8F7U0_9BACT|nr:SPOR domain-containing protein [Pseudodesulfovibrio profundus]MBC17372.1 hypothetical protein [Desulfovibrio sp.]SOB58644.1 putative Sporulation domain protein [Pseudodesulfovibrio profundus]|tara:strand:- start:1607 stop:2287 length:681 start_codon:yes stop_codon:yes gene_type:complete
MTKRFSISTLLALLLLMSTLVTAGCFRKHIVSTPPSKAPTRTTTTTAAPEPKPEVKQIEEEPMVIEETYEINAPKKEAITNEVGETDLGEEPLPEPEAVDTAATPAPEPAAPEVATTAPAAEPVVEAPAEKLSEPMETVDPANNTPAPIGDVYYVQVGAFSEQSNAENVLADLVARGYDESRIVESAGGLFKVQAGTFSGTPEAETAVEAMQDMFPKAFILKAPAQ